MNPVTDKRSMQGNLSDTELSERPTLARWVGIYRDAYSKYLNKLSDCGVQFSSYEDWDERIRAIKKRLSEKGLSFLHGGSSIHYGFISPACTTCVGGVGSRSFFLSLACHKDCFFCFNPNQSDFKEYASELTHWSQDLDEFKASVSRVTHIGLTGGEPLLFKEQVYAFISHARSLGDDVHTRLYTSGDHLDKACCERLRKAGLDEIRFSLKTYDEVGLVDSLAKIELARESLSCVVVEMPVMPNELELMKELLVALDELRVDGINLLEFCFPFNNWTEFEQRGFQIKNPPFDVLYSYGYAGGLPVAFSEEVCLELLEFACDARLDLGVHYCSLANKNKDQLLQQCSLAGITPDEDKRSQGVYQLDMNDCFCKAAKVFDKDVAPVRALLDRTNAGYQLEDDGFCLTFHPDLKPIVVRDTQVEETSPLVVMTSYNVVEGTADDWWMRELKLVKEG